MGPESSNPPIFSNIEPVLPVRDIRETIKYWQDVLGFPSQWTWGDPPNIGAVSWQNVHVQFYQPAEWTHVGSSVWIRLQRVESLYHLHLEKRPISSSPWNKSPGACPSTPSASSTATISALPAWSRKGKRTRAPCPQPSGSSPASQQQKNTSGYR
ncbi:hypothetical protein ACQ86N_40720 [Puia sp. P3]|uniref:hypothetical protein n=1 Tax=Puia sp. P3 TaxID=3423952 RepID=UPI003D67FED6